MEIKNYDMWTNKHADYPGKIRDEKNEPLCGFRLKQGKKHNTMQVINNGHILASYRYPNVEFPFSSSMVRWWNLLYCGGYSVRSESNKSLGENHYLLNDVLAQKKPIGYVFIPKEKEEANLSIFENSPVISKKGDVRRFYYGDAIELGIAQKGKVKDWFDIEALIESYKILSKKDGFGEVGIVTHAIQEKLRNLKEKELAELVFSYDYAHPSGHYELILTGLTLGFPIESTFAILTGGIK